MVLNFCQRTVYFQSIYFGENLVYWLVGWFSGCSIVSNLIVNMHEEFFPNSLDLISWRSLCSKWSSLCSPPDQKILPL